SSAAPVLGAMYRGTVPDGFCDDAVVFIANLSVDFDFVKTYGIELVAGRAHDETFGTDAQKAFRVTETAVREVDWETPDAALVKMYRQSVATVRACEERSGTEAKAAVLTAETAVREFSAGARAAALATTINGEGKLGMLVAAVRDFNFSSMATPTSALARGVGP